MAIPKKMQATYDEIWAIMEPYADTYLNDEYKALLHHALEKLCRKRPSPLLSGRAKTWAAGIIYAIGQNNFIFDTHQPVHMTATEIVEPLGVAKSTASSKAAEIRKMLKINYGNAEWILASDIERNSMIWWVSVDGFPVDARDLPLDMQIICAKKGLIPYVPALKQAEDALSAGD